MRLPDKTYLAECFRYDSDTGRLFWRERPLHHFSGAGRRSPQHAQRLFNSRYAGSEAFPKTKPSGYREGSLDGLPVKEHRIIWKMVHGTEPPEIDHDNGVKDDNRLDNLVDRDHTGNMRNCRRRDPRILAPVMGIDFHQRTGKWRLRVRLDGETHHIGLFATYDEALAERGKVHREAGFAPEHGARA